MSLALARYRGRVAEREHILDRLRRGRDCARANGYRETAMAYGTAVLAVMLMPDPAKPRSCKRKRAGGSR